MAHSIDKPHCPVRNYAGGKATINRGLSARSDASAATRDARFGELRERGVPVPSDLSSRKGDAARFKAAVKSRIESNNDVLAGKSSA